MSEPPVRPGERHPERPHWTLLPSEYPDEDDWIRDDGGVQGFCEVPDDTERVARFDEYDRRFPMTPSDPIQGSPGLQEG